MPNDLQEPVCLITLKRYLEKRPGHSPDVALDSFRQMLIAFGKTTTLAMPMLDSDLGQDLAAFSEQLSRTSTRAEIATNQAHIQAELDRWGLSAQNYLQKKTEEVKEIVFAVARTGDAIGQTNQSYIARLHDFTAALHAISHLEDISVLRDSVIQTATELNTCIAEIKVQSEQAVADLRKEIETCRTRVKETERRASMDALTGLINRSGLEREIEHRISNRRVFSVILIDLNNFKDVNDIYGHSAGDDLLKQFAKELASHCGPLSSVGRWGGDEFLVVVDVDLAGAENLTGSLTRWALGEYKIPTPEQPVKIDLTAAFGVAEWDSAESKESLFGRSDALMYQHKNKP